MRTSISTVADVAADNAGVSCALAAPAHAEHRLHPDRRPDAIATELHRHARTVRRIRSMRQTAPHACCRRRHPSENDSVGSANGAGRGAVAAAAGAVAGLTTALAGHLSAAFRVAPHVDAAAVVKALRCGIVSALTFSRCGPHRSLPSMWRPSTLMPTIELGGSESCSSDPPPNLRPVVANYAVSPQKRIWEPLVYWPPNTLV